MPSALRTPVIFGSVLVALATAFIYRKNFVDIEPLKQAIMREDEKAKEMLLAKIEEDRKKYFKK